MSQSKLEALAGPKLQKGVLIVGWLIVFLLVGSYIVAPSLAIAYYIVRFAANAPVVTPSGNFIGQDLLLALVLVTVLVLAYASVQAISLLSVSTFGEEPVETGREEATETIETAQETADSAAETIDEHTD